MRPVEYSPLAADDLERIGDYIAADNPQRAMTFVEELVALCERLADFPELGRQLFELGDGGRYLPHRNYLLLYRILADRIRIERVLHASRDVLSVIEGMTQK